VIKDVFDILDNAIVVGSENRFVLQELGDHGIFLPTIYERGAPGTSSLEGTLLVRSIQTAFLLVLIVFQSPGKWSRGFPKIMITFASGEEEVPHPKKAKFSETATKRSVVSTRVRLYIVSTEFLFIVCLGRSSQGFKMRLVYRDRGCVVCHAEGTASVYQYRDDSQFSRALTYSLSPGSHWYAHFEVLIVDSVEHNPSKVESAWISKSYHGPIYCNERRECYLQQARSTQNQFT